MPSVLEKLSSEWHVFDVSASLPTQANGLLCSIALWLRVKLLVCLMRIGSRLRAARLGGLMLETLVGGCNPAPLPGLSFEPLFFAGVDDLTASDHVLDMGTGCGVWALLAAKIGAEVTASDLEEVSLDIVAANAERNGLTSPKRVSGDLFEPVKHQRFNRILFNPPFHVGAVTRPSDKAYLGGENGAVVRRFLRDFSNYLLPDATACIILPSIELKQYANELEGVEVRVRAKQWVPVLGRVYLLELRRQ